MDRTAEAVADRIAEHFGTLILVGDEALCDGCGAIHAHLYALASDENWGWFRSFVLEWQRRGYLTC